MPATPEERLAASRARLRERLNEPGRQGLQHPPDISAGSLVSDALKPVARSVLRRHPYATLALAAVAGALVVRTQLWRYAGRALLWPVLRVTLSSGVALALRRALPGRAAPRSVTPARR